MRLIIYIYYRGFEPDMVVAGNLAHRILGLMAHWREAMNEELKIIGRSAIYGGPAKVQEKTSKL